MSEFGGWARVRVHGRLLACFTNAFDLSLSHSLALSDTAVVCVFVTA